ncbi:MAG: hypothetical protein IPN33_22120 [Saprospiraceae bacterium]|nr:hypothetical protein [Saprospiraceae bacterium]
MDNKLGLDNYYSNTIMPAYAHSYLLTAILSPDYVDSENNSPATKGPSDGDIGNYTKFKYGTKIEDYYWRVPLGSNEATFNEGLKSDLMDDKANYIYGEKELWYLDTIETKNYIAIFTLGDRKDGYGVIGKNGGRANTNPMKYLQKISLYVKRDYKKNPATAVAIKVVHFEYDYSLCPKVPNNINYGNPANNGKLTLKKIYFTYQDSNKAGLSPYKFFYAGYDKANNTYDARYNPPYNLKGYDRWGNYKPNTANSLSPTSTDIPTAEYPYVEQDQTTADIYTQAWSLTEIDLPSGGIINVDYESDDYAYVQNKRAGQMFKVIDVQTNTAPFKFNTITYNPPVVAPSVITPIELNDAATGKRLIIKLQDPITGTAPDKDDIFKNQYLGNIDNLYFRFLMDIKGGRCEYVSGYVSRSRIDFANCQVDVSGRYACITLLNTTTNDSGVDKINPITKAAIQFGRLNMSRVVWNSSELDDAIGDDGSFGEDLLKAIVKSNFFNNISDAIVGPNEALYSDKYKVGHNMITGKSWIRLNNPNMKKLGGGCRVRQIRISDEWKDMSNNTDKSFSYGQEYEYTLEDGITSSGVASYEPQLGGDENPGSNPCPLVRRNGWRPTMNITWKSLLASRFSFSQRGL